MNNTYRIAKKKLDLPLPLRPTSEHLQGGCTEGGRELDDDAYGVVVVFFSRRSTMPTFLLHHGTAAAAFLKHNAAVGGGRCGGNTFVWLAERCASSNVPRGRREKKERERDGKVLSQWQRFRTEHSISKFVHTNHIMLRAERIAYRLVPIRLEPLYCHLHHCGRERGTHQIIERRERVECRKGFI